MYLMNSWALDWSRYPWSAVKCSVRQSELCYKYIFTYYIILLHQPLLCIIMFSIFTLLWHYYYTLLQSLLLPITKNSFLRIITSLLQHYWIIITSFLSLILLQYYYTIITHFWHWLLLHIIISSLLQIITWLLHIFAYFTSL